MARDDGRFDCLSDNLGGASNEGYLSKECPQIQEPSFGDQSDCSDLSRSSSSDDSFGVDYYNSGVSEADDEEENVTNRQVEDDEY